MAVAVKPSPEKTTSRSTPSLPVISLAGMVYIIASLAIVFGLIPSLWTQIWTGNPDSFVSMAVMGLVCLAAGIALLVLGVRLLGDSAPAGSRAGIFTALVGLLLVMMLSRWFANFIEGWIHDYHWFGANGRSVGSIIVGSVAVAMLIYLCRLFFRPTFQQKLVAFEAQGWFTPSAYKAQQGLRVRRATILGILLLTGAGIYSLVVRDSLKEGDPTWGVNIPFTGEVVVTPQSMGDLDNLPVGDSEQLASYRDWAREAKAAIIEDKSAEIEPLKIDRYIFRDEVNNKLNPENYVKIHNPEGFDSKFENGQIVPKSEFQAEAEELEKEGREVPETKEPKPAEGETKYAVIPFFPNKQITIPLFLIAISLWLAWRVVNVPVFADFLIATEAEMNKVSWSTKRRLFQDTIVVLVTVFLMAAYLFSMDVAWQQLLSSDMVRVIYVSDNQDKIQKGADDRPLW